MGDRRLNPLHHRFREWWHAELEGKADVVLPEATSRAEQVFRDDSEVQDLFLNQYLYVVLYEYGVSMLSERRALLGEDGEWIGDPSPWLEFDPISRRHIAIESLTPEQAMAAAEFRERRIKTEQQRIAALKQLAEGQPVDSVIKTLPSTSLRDRMRGRAKPMDCHKCGRDLADLVENVEFPKVTAEWRCRCGEPVTDEQGAEIDRIGFEITGSEGVTLWERLYGPVGSTEHPHFPTRHGEAPTVEQTGFCAACDAEIVYRCLFDGTPCGTTACFASRVKDGFRPRCARRCAIRSITHCNYAPVRRFGSTSARFMASGSTFPGEPGGSLISETIRPHIHLSADSMFALLTSYGLPTRQTAPNSPTN